jgi:hypothetical protein
MPQASPCCRARAVSEVIDRLWEDYQAAIARDLSAVEVRIPGRIQLVAATSSLNRSAGVSHERVLRGRSLSKAAMASSSAWE